MMICIGVIFVTRRVLRGTGRLGGMWRWFIETYTPRRILTRLRSNFRGGEIEKAHMTCNLVASRHSLCSGWETDGNAGQQVMLIEKRNKFIGSATLR